MSNKLRGIPQVYYLNLDERPDRREYTESQYETWGIQNYTRVSASKFKVNNFEEWKYLIHSNDKLYEFEEKICRLANKPRKILIETATSVSYLEIIKNWLINSNDQYMIIMEDDYDLSYIEYWHFDWEYLMNNIPYDWDCIQMSFENDEIFPCYLHPIMVGHGCGGSLITRSYAEKLLKIHLIDGKYCFDQKISNSKWSKKIFTVDYFLGHCGKTYVLPLFSMNIQFGSYEENFYRKQVFDRLKFTKVCYDIWWKKLKDKYTLEEFFMFGKKNDLNLTKDFITNFHV